VQNPRFKVNQNGHFFASDPCVFGCWKISETKRKARVGMQEDVLGTRRTAIPEKLVTCSRCNKVVRLRDARLVQSDVLSGTISEYEYICRECDKALAEGEKDIIE
jgi:hypothetical protein